MLIEIEFKISKRAGKIDYRAMKADEGVSGGIQMNMLERSSG